MISEVEFNYDDRRFQRLPRWAKKAFIEDSIVYLPTWGMSEKLALLALSFDGAKCIFEYGHVYVPSDWLKNEVPRKCAVSIENAKRRALEAIR